MAHNHLEQLIAEWYEYQGYFVKRNVLVGPRPNGGYESELDVVAYNPHEKHLVHIEPSLDADSWDNRERRFRKKFDAGRKYIKDLFRDLPISEHIEQIAVLVFASRTYHPNLGGGRVMIADELIEKIFIALKDIRLESNAIPEQLTILRSFQYINQYRNAVINAWNTPSK